MGRLELGNQNTLNGLYAEVCDLLVKMTKRRQEVPIKDGYDEFTQRLFASSLIMGAAQRSGVNGHSHLVEKASEILQDPLVPEIRDWLSGTK